MGSYYDVLGVPTDADQAAIRKAYLRASLRCHPDKNPGREEQAKAEFVEVGTAYSVLSDASQRAAYDRQLAGGKGWGRPQYRRQQQQQQQQSQRPQTDHSAQQGATSDGGDDAEFRHFMNMFDETVGSMSEEELNMAMGAAAVVGGIIGSILGARAGGGARGGSSFLSSAASMVGSAMASRAASSFVQTVHEDSKQRVLERNEREAAIARGERVPEPTARESRERLFQDAGRAFQKVAGAAVGGAGGSERIRFSVNSGNNASGRPSARSGNGGGAGEQQGFSWAQAAKLAAMAAGVCAEMQKESGANAKNQRR